MTTKKELDDLRLELSIKCKNGVNFICAAVIVWLIIAYIWTWENPAFEKCIFTFYAGVLLLPLAWVLSKVMKTAWSVAGNPLDSLGLWFNFAQLFYFPILFLVLSKMPQYFLTTYVIITGAHFFLYSWYYDTKWFAIMAGVMSVGALMMTQQLASGQMYWVGLFMSGSMAVLALGLYWDYRQKLRKSV
jgi:hypothetical protein